MNIHDPNVTLPKVTTGSLARLAQDLLEAGRRARPARADARDLA